MTISTWNLSRICTNLKRWSFASKMKMAYFESKKQANPFQYLTNPSRNEYLLDEIETFVMLSIKNKEWRDEEMTNMDLNKVINGIRAFHHPKFRKSEGTDLTTKIFCTVVSNQIIHQYDLFYLISRYMFYFSYIDEHINMRSLFQSKFGVDYKDVVGPISLYWYTLLSDCVFQLTPEGQIWLSRKYKHVFDLLTITRESYIQQLDQISNDINDYRYCFRPSYQKPFIAYAGKRYLATPHLLIHSVTTSLMYRLTEDDNELRKKIGLHVLEKYLYKIIKENEEFDEVLPEQEYGNSQRTLDVLTRIGEDIICFDSKFYCPSIGIKTFSDEAIARSRNRLAEEICQAYKQIHDKFGSEYTYLSVPVKEDKSNIFAVVVITEESYICRETIYEEAAKELNILNPSLEYDWLRGHIGITEISMLERQLFDRDGFNNEVKENLRTGQYTDFWFFKRSGNESENTRCVEMIQNLWPDIEKAAQIDGINLIINKKI